MTAPKTKKVKAPAGLVQGTDGALRCFWATSDPLYEKYHDEEWGRPVFEDRRLFEKICLEGFQSGLSWLTILKKRESFRAAFFDFDLDKVARINGRGVDKLLLDPGIVRHRGKIESTINNARQAKNIVREFGSLSKYFWQFVPDESERPKKVTRAALSNLSKTPTSLRLSEDLKERGFTYVGAVTCYAFMQAMGLVNDHMDECPSREGSGPSTTR